MIGSAPQPISLPNIKAPALAGYLVPEPYNSTVSLIILLTVEL